MQPRTSARVIAADPAGIAEAADRLKQGGLVAFPTETVYGLGAVASNTHSVARAFQVKGRPRFNPMIIHVADLKAAEREGQTDERARALAARFWPGPLTLVVPRHTGSDVAELACAGLPSLALRAPAHPVAQALIRAVRAPLAAPSANRSGHVSPTSARHVRDDLGSQDILILDGGPTAIGIESTVVDLTGAAPAILRTGAISADDLHKVLRTDLTEPREDPDRPTSPGRLPSHYAPDAPLRLEAHDWRSGEALLAFGPPLLGAGPCFNLSPAGDLVEAAANLYAGLRALDADNPRSIAVMPIPHHGLGEPINDRLSRAAAPRTGAR